jgi:hypothetical protein
MGCEIEVWVCAATLMTILGLVLKSAFVPVGGKSGLFFFDTPRISGPGDGLHLDIDIDDHFIQSFYRSIVEYNTLVSTFIGEPW